MGELVYRPLLGDMFDSQLLLNSSQFLVPFLHDSVFFVNFINLALELSLNILWKHRLCPTLRGPLLFHKLFDPSEFGLHFNDFCLEEILL